MGEKEGRGVWVRDEPRERFGGSPSDALAHLFRRMANFEHKHRSAKAWTYDFNISTSFKASLIYQRACLSTQSD